MEKTKWYLILINLVALLIFFNISVFQKEDILKSGKLILLKLAPVDPRSLMQGDYMNLRYNWADNIKDKQLSKRGYCVLKLDSNNIAHVVRFQDNITPLKEGELIIKYTSPNGYHINIGAESYFFQEGEGHKFEKGAYGALKVDAKGNSLLIGLYDTDLKIIQ